MIGFGSSRLRFLVASHCPSQSLKMASRNYGVGRRSELIGARDLGERCSGLEVLGDPLLLVGCERLDLRIDHASTLAPHGSLLAWPTSNRRPA